MPLWQRKEVQVLLHAEGLIVKPLTGDPRKEHLDRTQRERILDYLWSVSPEKATNSEILNLREVI